MTAESAKRAEAERAHLEEVLFDESLRESASEHGSLDDYRVHLPAFEGPLDLLLHLIRKDQIEIYDIPIAKICSSYLQYIERMQSPDVNLAGEFMVMAASLMFIKSQLLLPREETEMDEDDPRLPLVAQLLEYEKFKKAAEALNEREWVGRDVFLRPEGTSKDLIPAESLADAPIAPHEVFPLLVALKIALDRTTRPPMLIELDPTSLREKVSQIRGSLERHELAELAEFIPPARPRREIILAFLAMLELSRLKFIQIIQHENMGPIQIRRIRSLVDLDETLLDQF